MANNRKPKVEQVISTHKNKQTVLVSDTVKTIVVGAELTGGVAFIAANVKIRYLVPTDPTSQIVIEWMASNPNKVKSTTIWELKFEAVPIGSNSEQDLGSVTVGSHKGQDGFIYLYNNVDSSVYTSLRVRVRPALNGKDYEKEVTWSNWFILQTAQTNGDNIITDSTESPTPSEPEAPTPQIPASPTVSIEGSRLTASVDYYDSNNMPYIMITFNVVATDPSGASAIAGTSDVILQYNRATAIFDLVPGKDYKVQAKATYVTFSGAETIYGVASSYSAFASVGITAPGSIHVPLKFSCIKLNSVKIYWPSVDYAESYEIEYTKKRFNFGQTNLVQSVTTTNSYVILTGLEKDETIESRNTWWVRIRAVNSSGKGPWTDISDGRFYLDTPPAAPTTWQTENTIELAAEQTTYTHRVYWIHNSEDNSPQTGADIEIKLYDRDDKLVDTVLIEKPKSTSTYQRGGFYYDISIDSSSIGDGYHFEWRIRTYGNKKKSGPWSLYREVQVYTKPQVLFSFFRTVNWYWDPFNFYKDTIYTAIGDLTDSYGTDGNLIFTEYPIYLQISTYPATQTPLRAILSFVSQDDQTTLDDTGHIKKIPAGSTVYQTEVPFAPGMAYNPARFSPVIDRTDLTQYDMSKMIFILLPQDLGLSNYSRYKITCTVFMDTGLSAYAEVQASTNFLPNDYSIGCEFTYDPETTIAYLKPFCRNWDPDKEEYYGDPIQGVTLSVFRREFDGGYVPIATDIINSLGGTIIDPHPTLNNARYRIVARDLTSYNISYYDTPPLPVGENGIVIQWDEQSEMYTENTPVGERVEQYTSSMVFLPWNVDTKESSTKDVSTVAYIGRENPVSYYGTQKGQSATWSSDIPYNDQETLFALRRLAVWPGDAYVREPNGVGYWATVKVSITTTHRSVVVPVTIEVTRVEGGA